MKTIQIESGKQEIPVVFFLLTQFFYTNPKHFEEEGLFRKNGDSVNINEISIHLSRGNFSILQEVADKPHDIANFLKQILRELAEPICPFNLYTKFRDMEKTDS